MKEIEVFSPATVANFIIGFDSLGAALEPIDGTPLGDSVLVKEEKGHDDTLEINGSYKEQMPTDPNDNLVMIALNAFNDMMFDRNVTIHNVKLCLKKRLPICSGLGSSASSLIATMTALNAYYGHPLSDKELVVKAGELEGITGGDPHYDNVFPAMYGGLQLLSPNRKRIKLPWFKDLLIVIYYPGIKVATKEARRVLPKTIEMEKLVDYGRRLSTFVHALYVEDKELALSTFRYDLIERYRSDLIPNYFAGKNSATGAGALAFGLSGSGSSCFAIVDSLKNGERVCDALMESMQGTEQAFAKICKIGDGVKVVPL